MTNLGFFFFFFFCNMKVYNIKTISYLQGCPNERYHVEIKSELFSFPASSRFFGEVEIKANSPRFETKENRGHTVCCLDHIQESDHMCKASFIKKKLKLKKNTSKAFYTYDFIFICPIAIENIVHAPGQGSDESVQRAVKLPVSLCNLVLPSVCSHWLRMYSHEGDCFSKALVM